eukprot:IDg9181t1
MGFFAAKELIRLLVGIRYKFDALPMHTPTLPFAIVSFAAPELGYQGMRALDNPLQIIVFKIMEMVTRRRWKSFSQTILLLLDHRIFGIYERNFLALPQSILENVIVIATAVLMSIAATRRFKYGRDTLLMYIVAVLARFLLSELSKNQLRMSDEGWFANYRSLAICFCIEGCLLIFLLFLAQIMSSDVRRYYQLQFRRIRFLVVSKNYRQNDYRFRAPIAD